MGYTIKRFYRGLQRSEMSQEQSKLGPHGTRTRLAQTMFMEKGTYGLCLGHRHLTNANHWLSISVPDSSM